MREACVMRVMRLVLTRYMNKKKFYLKNTWINLDGIISYVEKIMMNTSPPREGLCIKL